MKSLRLPVLALAGLVLSIASLPAATLHVASRLDAATVYLDRAVVTRTARVTLAAGQSELVFERLPASLLDASLQVSGRGTAGATILDVGARQTFVEASPSMRVRALEDELAGLRRQDVAFADKLAHVEQQQGLLTRIELAMTTPPASEAAAPRPSFEEWQRLLAFQAEHLTRFAAERQSLQRERRELADKIAAVEQQLNAQRGQQPGGRSFKTVTVRVAADSPGELELALAYAMPGASWTPAYDARLRSEQRTVALTYYGVVRNGTGEDWSDLALTLSTARPSLGGGAPELTAWIVEEARPVPLARDLGQVELNAFVVGRGRGQGAPATSAREGEPPMQASSVATAAVNASATSATFRIATRVTLPSDNTTQKVAITALPLPATLQYESTPKLAEAAFLTANAKNVSEFPLLAGAVSAFLDETFVATSRLKTVMPGETFDLSLGADDGVAVKRRLVNRFSEETGFITSKGRRVTYDVLITLTNNKRTPERIVFREAVPVSRHEKIVVKLLAPVEREIGTVAAPKEITREEDGRLAWRLDLKPGEKREIAFKVSVEHPADLAVAGLD